MQHLFLIESFEDFLVVSLLPSQEISLRSNGVFPLFGVFLILFVGLFGLFLQFLKFLLFLVDGLDFFLDFPDFNPINPNILALLIWNVLTEPNLVITYSLPHFVPFHLVTLDDILKHLLLASQQKFFLDLEFLFEQVVFFSYRFVLWTINRWCRFLVGVEVLLFRMRLWFLHMLESLFLRMRRWLLPDRLLPPNGLLTLYMLLAYLIDDRSLWLLSRGMHDWTKTEVVRDFLVLLDLLLRQHVEYWLTLWLIAVLYTLLFLYPVFLPFMPFLRLCAFYALYRLLIVTHCWIATFFTHPVLKQTDPLQLGIHHFLNYNLNAPSLNLLEI